MKSKNTISKDDIPAPSSALSGAIEHLIQQGMPIDLEHIMAIKNEIAEGHYPLSAIVISRKPGENNRANGL